MKVKIKRKGNKLQNIKESVKRLHNQSTQVGYFASQGKHIGRDKIADYSFVGLAQALELGLTLSKVNFQKPMPFMNNIGMLAIKGMRNSTSVKRAYRAWGRELHAVADPTHLLDTIGKYAQSKAKEVFNNPSYFPQNKENKTPIFETGELFKHFAYKNTISNTVRV